MRRHILIATGMLLSLTAMGQQWPVVNPEARPGTRWWWLGSAVDSVNLTRNLETYARAGIGAVEITPIYGVKGNEAHDIPFLSERWMRMLGHTIAEGKRLGIEVDMNTGTGWPFGGPEVTAEEAAQKAVFSTDADGQVQLALTPTRQKVKRAAPGGEGWVMDHFNPQAVQHYLERFDRAFAQSGVAAPHTFFNDSYEVYGADWTPALLGEFERRRGYRLQDHWQAFLDEGDSTHWDVLSDYRETLGDLLLENFTRPWTEWAHRHGAKTRNQAHGSPANLLDAYAAVDIPEIEGYGLSDFGLKGLRTDTLTRPNYSDLSMLKYPASAAHFYGKPFVSAETFTWLTEHFRTSLSQCKPDFDLMMVAGVNHCYFHGCTYSPAKAAWPGHLFYAAMEMSPINTIWHDAPAFFQYITRVQSWMQYGEADNDLLIYLPVYDLWRSNKGRLLMFDIHKMDRVAPTFIHAVSEVYGLGYDMDYVSDRMIADVTGVDAQGRIVAPSGLRYKALLLPEVKHMPQRTRQRIEELRAQGATIIEVNHPDGYRTALQAQPALRPELMKLRHGLKCIRRRNDKGYHYFVSCLQPQAVEAWVPLTVGAEQVYRFDPLTGSVHCLPLRDGDDGCAEVFLQLASGESCVLQTLTVLGADDMQEAADPPSVADEAQAIDLTPLRWTLSPTELQTWEPLKPVRLAHGLQPWTALPRGWQTAKGTARYTVSVRLTRQQITQNPGWWLDLGDVRESAHVRVNGQDAGTAFCVPFRLNVGHLLHAGNNVIEIDVTSLAANYVAEMDRRGVEWRIFKDANIANLNGGKVSYYGGWDVMPAGLNGKVQLVPFVMHPDWR